VQSRNFRSFEVYAIATLMYLGLTLGFRSLFWAAAQVLFPNRRAIGVAATGAR
jgi:ABC-type amino acid transport system permease subunit